MENFVKLNGEEDDYYELLVPKVKELYDFLMEEYGYDLWIAMWECESPIEQIMALIITEVEKNLNLNNRDIELLGIEKQKTIKTKNKNYRVDFLLKFAFWNGSKEAKTFNLVIECDGHDFHEKTKEQVKKNNQRDRDLQKEDFNVLHFSGSEIYNEWWKCRDDIFDYIIAKYDSLKSEHRGLL